jgi:hypothetical protein
MGGKRPESRHPPSDFALLSPPLEDRLDLGLGRPYRVLGAHLVSGGGGEHPGHEILVEDLVDGGVGVAGMAQVRHPLADLVVRGWPLTVEGLLQNADDARSRFSWRGEPLVAVSAEATVGGRTLDELLAGSRLRTRRRYASAVAQRLLDERFVLLPSFGAPHYDIVLKAYAEGEARRLLDVLGEAHQNPYYVRRQR